MIQANIHAPSRKDRQARPGGLLCFFPGGSIISGSFGESGKKKLLAFRDKVATPSLPRVNRLASDIHETQTQHQKRLPTKQRGNGWQTAFETSKQIGIMMRDVRPLLCPQQQGAFRKCWGYTESELYQLCQLTFTHEGGPWNLNLGISIGELGDRQAGKTSKSNSVPVEKDGGGARSLGAWRNNVHFICSRKRGFGVSPFCFPQSSRSYHDPGPRNPPGGNPNGLHRTEIPAFHGSEKTPVTP